MTGTVVHRKGQGALRQERPKTDASIRLISVPEFAAEVLRRRLDGVDEAQTVFASRSGGPLSPYNVRRTFRDFLRLAGLGDTAISLRWYRRTGATVIARAMATDAAATFLGHTSAAITEGHYIELDRTVDLTPAAHLERALRWPVTGTRWAGYLLSTTSGVLLNKVHATTAEELRAAENDLVEARLAELRAQPTLIDRTYDLGHLQAIHRHLFQDVYEWAGELRTVGINKGEGESFAPPRSIEQPFDHVAQRIAQRIAESDRLKNLQEVHLASEVAYLYDYDANFAHPFREGNGRSQREFLDQLLAESGHGLDWDLLNKTQLHDACHLARNESQLDGLIAIFNRILDQAPAY